MTCKYGATTCTHAQCQPENWTDVDMVEHFGKTPDEVIAEHRAPRENSATPDPDRRAVERFAAILANIRNDAIEERAAEILYLLRSDAQHLLADLNPHGVWAKTLRNMESLRSLSSRGETKGDKP